MRPIGEFDHIHLVPLSASAIADFFAAADNPYGTHRLSYDGATDLPAVAEDDLPVLEVVEEVPGGCLVRTGALLTCHEDLIPFCTARVGRSGSRALQDLDDAVDRAERLVVHALNGVPAMRSKGRWRAVDAEDRQAWGRHLTRMNAVEMRARADTSWQRHLADIGASILRTPCTA